MEFWVFMKALILCAGYATRLYPLTVDTPKPLLKVGKKPMIEHIIAKIDEIENIDEILVVTNNAFYNNFMNWNLGFEHKKPIKIINDGTTSNETRLGAVGDIDFVVKNLGIDDDLIVIAGDNLFEFSLAKMFDFFNDKKSTVVGVYDIVDKSKAANKLGVVELDNGSKMIGFEEKPAEPKTSLVSTACYFFTKNDLVELDNCIKDGKMLDNTGDFIRQLSSRNPVYGFVFKENWFDIGSHDQLEYVNKIYSTL